jgi:hypothetical protein
VAQWNVFSHDHDAIAADERQADIVSFRAGDGFVDEHVTRDQDGWREVITCASMWERFASRDAPTLTPVTHEIPAPQSGVSRLRATSPKSRIVDRIDGHGYSRQSALRALVAIDQLEAQNRRTEVERFRAELRVMNARAREDATDRP